MERTENYKKKTFGFKTAISTEKINENIPRQPLFNSPTIKMEKQIFKVNSKIPIKQRNMNSAVNPSPKRGVRSGRVTDAKARKNIFPVGNFNYSRRTLNYIKSKNTSRKEILEKVVKALNEGKELKPPTPVKINIPVTPRTPGSGKGYLVFPEFKKLKMKKEGESPGQDILRQKRVTRSRLLLLQNNSLEEKPKNIEVYEELINHLRKYSAEVELIFKKMKTINENFENKVECSPEYVVYEEYVKYEGKKEKLYTEIHLLEEKLKSFLRSKVESGEKIKDFFQTQRQLLEEVTKCNKDFEKVVAGALEKRQKDEDETSEF